MADAVTRDPNRDFWAEVKTYAAVKLVWFLMDDVMSLPFPSCLPAITVISSPVCRISSLICKVLSPVLRRNSYSILCFIASSDVLRAISKLKLHLDDGDLGSASDYFVYASPDPTTHVALLFTGIVMVMYLPLFCLLDININRSAYFKKQQCECNI